MKQPGECPSSDKWSPAMDHSATTRHNSHRHYNRNYCYHRHHQYHYRYHLHHHHQHICQCNHKYVNVNRSKDKMLRDDNRYRSSFHFSVIFLNTLFYNHDDDEDTNANTDANDDGNDNDNADANYDNDSDEIFLTEDISRFMVRGTPFASSYVW